MQLELKHLAPYLPYGLKIKAYTKSLACGYLTEDELKTSTFEDKNIEDIVPILRPLSEFYRDGFGGYESFQDFKIAVDNKLFPYYVFETLFENHFDVFGLISQGLAIDINTIKQ